MVNDMTWEEFCSLYYESAVKAAGIHLEKLRSRLGGWDPRVDESYVVDSSVLSALEKTFSRYDPLRGCRIATYLSSIVHNDLVDNLEREVKEAAMKASMPEARRCDTVEDVASVLPQKVIDHLMDRLRSAISLLSPSDQVILKFYIDDASTYVERSVELLGVSENCVRVRRSRIFGRLPRLMGVTAEEYREMFECSVLAGRGVKKGVVRTETNPIWPDLDLDDMARALCARMLGS